MRQELKILIVEDEPISQRVAQLSLENMGYQVDIAGCGQEAIQLFSKQHYAAILMDLGLPDMAGDKVTMQMRQLENHKTRTPIIALTAHVFYHDKKRCFEAGMDDFLEKPLDMRALQAVLTAWTRPLCTA